MFDRFLEYREAQQFRKARQRRQNIRYLIMFSAVLLVLLLGAYVVDAVKPAEATDTKPVATAPNQPEVQETQEIQEEQQVTSEIERFAYIVTKPMDTLTSEDIDFMGEKAKDPCYEKNAMLPRDQMVEAITACKILE